MDQYQREDAADAELLSRLHDALELDSEVTQRYDSQRAWPHLKRRLVQPRAASIAATAVARPSRLSRMSGTLRWAAVLTLLIGGSGLLVHRQLTPEVQYALLLTPVSTSTGEVSTVRLDDGTVVVLGPQSAIAEVPGRGRERRIVLRGIAHFDVVRDAVRPFIVTAGGAETRVLGTSFSVRGYGDGSPLHVVVESGRVSLTPTGSEHGVVLRPGQSGTVESNGNLTVQSGVDVSRLIGWKDGTLAFDGAPLRLVAADIERWYGVRVGIADSTLADYPLTATFARAPVEVVLAISARSLGIRHTFDGKTAVFSR